MQLLILRFYIFFVPRLNLCSEDDGGHARGGSGDGHQGGHCRQWSSGQEQHDPAILQRHFYKGLQENHWSGLPGEAD